MKIKTREAREDDAPSNREVSKEGECSRKDAAAV
jgi:hypothetical protein